MQVKLLRVIQEKAVRPVGAEHEIPVDVRILSASHKNLEQLVSEGQLRQDLYYRINVIDLTVPSLRDRPEDIPILTQQLLSTIAEKSNLERTPGISKSAVEALMDYSFPGNVRELENILERALALADNNIIEKDDLALNNQAQAQAQPQTAETATRSLDLEGQEKSSIMQALEKTRWNKTAAAKLLGLSLRQLRYRLEKFGID
jgi:two-component system response regulator PilR (NtrC family)